MGQAGFTPAPLPSGTYDFYAPAASSGSTAWGPAATPSWSYTAPAPVGLPAAPAESASESGLPVPLAVGVTLLALLLSFGLRVLSSQSTDTSVQIDTQLRRALVITLFFYVLLGLALLVFCVQRRVGLTWARGHGVEAVLLGLPLGAAMGGLAVALNSGIAGHLASDPRIELLVGGGGALRITLALVVTAVLAPLVEETLFRGVLGGSLLARNSAAAVWYSAIAFSVWHMSPAALRYYIFMGLLLAGLWRKRGLVASMSAHAAFNGVLTIAAVAATTGVGSLTHFGQLGFQPPGGWHHVEAASAADRTVYEGPGGAALAVVRKPNDGHAPTRAQLLAGLATGEGGTGTQVVPGSERAVHVPAGDAVEADVVVMNQPGHLLAVPVGDSTYVLLVITGGSPAAERDWPRIVASVRDA